MYTIGVSIFLSIFKISKLKKFKCYLNLIMGFPGGSVVKNPPTSVWRCWFNLWSGKSGASLVAQKLKRLPAMREIRVRSLGGEDPLEKGMATHSSILAWRIPWREDPGRLQSTGSQRVRHCWATSLHWENLLEKEMATCCNNLLGRAPWTEEPGRLQSMGLQKVGHYLATEQQI